MLVHINFEDLELNFGYSCMPNRLHFYSEKENECGVNKGEIKWKVK
jgi:hypothetical protein